MQTREAEVHQRIDVAVGNGDYTAAAPAITAIRPAFFDIFFTPKTGRTVAAVTRDNFDF